MWIGWRRQAGFGGTRLLMRRVIFSDLSFTSGNPRTPAHDRGGSQMMTGRDSSRLWQASMADYRRRGNDRSSRAHTTPEGRKNNCFCATRIHKLERNSIKSCRPVTVLGNALRLLLDIHCAQQKRNHSHARGQSTVRSCFLVKKACSASYFHPLLQPRLIPTLREDSILLEMTQTRRNDPNEGMCAQELDDYRGQRKA